MFVLLVRNLALYFLIARKGRLGIYIILMVNLGNVSSLWRGDFALLFYLRDWVVIALKDERRFRCAWNNWR